ncbi:MAG: hypothetical protein GXP08_04195 [Gammaproteobacteria bacterium]|nr:hypothetical protein [Gammaproteobacteria bacterium]
MLLKAIQYFSAALLLAALSAGCYDRDNREPKTGPAKPESVVYTKTAPGCLQCHANIENIHPNISIACTECHGGDYSTITKQQAHVQTNGRVIYDDSVPPLDDDLAYQQFVNPSNLRVAEKTCGRCHTGHVERVKKSLMAHTAGHHSGGLYQSSIDSSKTPTYGTVAVEDNDNSVPVDQGAVPRLLDLISWDNNLDFTDPDNPKLKEYKTHFRAVPEQACVRCHLWTRGKGYRGAAAIDDDSRDGLFRADGCAACHMIYANDGLSRSSDTAINKVEKGHPLRHRLTKAIPTEQCVHCHHRGARIGLNITGRTQMPPRLASGPGITGTTDVKFNGNYHYADPETNPPDIHHERGMHCIDCHTQAGVMGDGNIYGHQDQATKIECRTCHGTPSERGSLRDKDGKLLNNVSRNNDGSVVLISKVDNVAHEVPQLIDIVNKNSTQYNPKAAKAMDHNHIKDDGGLECFSCHASWMPNCFGCHFERVQNGKGKNLLTGETEEWQASTNNKMYVALRHFAMGVNGQRKISPFIVGCHPIAEVIAKDGTKLLDFVMPETTQGKSGLAHNPTHSHTVRSVGEVRTCVECHRSPPALGLGSGNYILARSFAYLVDSGGKVQVFERWAEPTAPVFAANIGERNNPSAIATVPNIVSGRTDFMFVAYGAQGISVFDLRDASTANIAELTKTPLSNIQGVDVVDLFYAAGYLYAVMRDAGVTIYDATEPGNLRRVSSIDIPNAQRIALWGVDLFVAAGDKGLIVVDVADHSTPNIAGALTTIKATDIVLYAHFQKDNQFSSRAYVVDPGYGVRIVDLLPDFSQPRLVGGIKLVGANGVDTYTRYVEAHENTPSREHDYLYVAAGERGLHIFDITVPETIIAAGVITAQQMEGKPQDVQLISHPAPPGVDDYAYVATDAGLSVIDVNDPLIPKHLINLKTATAGSRVYVEGQQLDRFVDEFGRELKENSHPNASPLNRDEIVRLLRAPL